MSVVVAEAVVVGSGVGENTAFSVAAIKAGRRVI